MPVCSPQPMIAAHSTANRMSSAWSRCKTSIHPKSYHLSATRLATAYLGPEALFQGGLDASVRGIDLVVFERPVRGAVPQRKGQALPPGWHGAAVEDVEQLDVLEQVASRFSDRLDQVRMRRGLVDEERDVAVSRGEARGRLDLEQRLT